MKMRPFLFAVCKLVTKTKIEVQNIASVAFLQFHQRFLCFYMKVR